LAKKVFVLNKLHRMESGACINKENLMDFGWDSGRDKPIAQWSSEKR